MRISARSILMAGVTTAHGRAPSRSRRRCNRLRRRDLKQRRRSNWPRRRSSCRDKAALTTWLAALQRQSPNAAGAVQTRRRLRRRPRPLGLFAFPGLGNAIIGAYNTIEPWVAYGVEVADWALGWIPFGWLIGRPDQHLLRRRRARRPIHLLQHRLSGVGGFDQLLGRPEQRHPRWGERVHWSPERRDRSGLASCRRCHSAPRRFRYLPWFGLLTQTAPTSAGRAGA